MEILSESWSLVVILLSAFIIGWAAEVAQTFMSRALALSILAWLQTAPEFAVEATIAWHQQKDLMIANLTGSLRLLVGLGLPMIFFVHFFFKGAKEKKWVSKIRLDKEDSVSVLFLFISVVYFIVIWAKSSLTVIDSGFLILIYAAYLIILARQPVHAEETDHDLPWIGKIIVRYPKNTRIMITTAMFVMGGLALYFTVHPFIHTLEKWSITLGVSTFVFVQWVAPFLSEFPEKVSAFNWARQSKKAPMAMMNMVSSNINQWTMLAAMIPLVYNLSLGRVEAFSLDPFHRLELLLTIAQSFLVGLLLLDLEFSLWDALIVFNLWIAQFLFADIREAVMFIYIAWSVLEVLKIGYQLYQHRKFPAALQYLIKRGH